MGQTINIKLRPGVYAPSPLSWGGKFHFFSSPSLLFLPLSPSLSLSLLFFFISFPFLSLFLLLQLEVWGALKFF